MLRSLDSKLAPGAATAGHAYVAPLPSCTPLPIARYRFTFRMQDELRLPKYAGSLLRGQFGASLRRTACLTGAPTCKGCPLIATCPYPEIFEAPPPGEHRLQRFSQVPNPYVIEPPGFGTRGIRTGECLVFGMVLVGRALQRLPLIVHAQQRALGHGLGRERARGMLAELEVQVADEWMQIWDGARGRIQEHEAQLAIPEFAAADTATLQIATPLRLQNQGHPLGIDKLSPRVLVTNLLRRATLLLELHNGNPPLLDDMSARELARHAETIRDERRLRWQDWSRYSSRQKQEMTLGGVVGAWTLKGDLAPVLPLLWLGQWLHAGKNAVMGMGGYTLSLE
jgi:hypothetical protein